MTGWEDRANLAFGQKCFEMNSTEAAGFARQGRENQDPRRFDPAGVQGAR
jgi:hypothetical protein